MKKIFTFVAAALLMAVPALFTSCDDDPWYDDWGWHDDYWDNGDNYDDNDNNSGNTLQDEAEVLQGEWEGKMAYTNSSNGQVDNFYANMTFVRNDSYSIKGTGTEMDYVLKEDGTPDYNNINTLKFDWYISNNGNIHIKYLTTNQTEFVLDASATTYGFTLDEKTGAFNGYMLGTNTKDQIEFDFKRVQNNNAKKLFSTSTSSTTTSVFGKGSAVTLPTGVQRLTTRR